MFTQYSTPQAPPDLYQPLPLEQILQGAKTVYDRGEQNFEKIQGLVNAAYSIPSLPGKDTEVKNKKMQQYMANVQELAKGNLSDPRIANQIQGYISSVAQDPDILSIAERATSYANMLKEEKEARLKGQKYFNKGLFDARRYMEGNTYQRDTRFSNQGGIAPDEAEILKKVKDIAQVTVSQKREKGIITTVEEVLEKEGKDLYNKIASSDPNYRNYYRTMWDEQNYDKTPEQIFTENISPLYNNLVENTTLLQDKIATSKTDIERANYMSQLNNTLDKISQLEELRDNPNTIEELKELAFNRQLKQSSNAAIKAITGISKIDVETDQVFLENMKFKNDLIKEQAKDLSLGASLMNKSLSEVMSNPQLMAQAAQLSQQAKLTEFSQKENIKLQNKIAGKENAVKGGFKFTDSDTISYVDEKGDSKTIQYGTLKDEIKKANKETVRRMVAAVLNQKNSNDGSWIPLTPDQVTVTGDGEKRKFKIRSTYGFGGESIPIDDVIDISNFTTSQTTTSQNQNIGQIELSDGTKVNAVVLSNPSDTSTLKKGEYAIVNGQPFLKD